MEPGGEEDGDAEKAPSPHDGDDDAAGAFGEGTLAVDDLHGAGEESVAEEPLLKPGAASGEAPGGDEDKDGGGDARHERADAGKRNADKTDEGEQQAPGVAVKRSVEAGGQGRGPETGWAVERAVFGNA